MKSKKSIFVVALAALMLIAFTACEQAPIVMDPNGKIPTNVIITQTGDFVEGQQFDSSKFSVSVVYEDGTTDPVNNANIAFKPATGETAVTSGSYVEVSVTTISKEGNGTVTVSGSKTLDVYPITDLTITGTVAPGFNGSGFVSAIKESDLTVVANYLDADRSKQSITLDPSEYKMHSTPQIAAGETAPSAEGETAVCEQAVYVTFGDSTKTSQDNYGMGVYTFTSTYVDSTTAEPTYAWFDHQVVYGQVAPTTSGSPVVYVQRGEFDADSMIKLYKVYAPEDATTLGDDYYLVPLATSDYIANGLSMELANPYTSSTITADISDRFGTSSTANVEFSMTYVGNTGTGAYTTKTSVDGSIVIADLEKVTGEAIPSGITGDCYTGEIASGSTITLTGILADYPLTLSVAVASTVTQQNPLPLGQQYSNLLGTSITANVATWKSGIQAVTGYVVNESATSYGTLTFNPAVTVNETTSITTQTVKWTFVPTIQYEDSNASTVNLGSGSITPYVAAGATE